MTTYCRINFPTKKALKEAVAKGQKVGIYQAGIGLVPVPHGEYFISGPHAPKPHTWHAQVRLDEQGWVKEVK